MKRVKLFFEKYMMAFPLFLLILLFSAETLISIAVSQKLYYCLDFEPGTQVLAVELTKGDESGATPLAEITQVQENEGRVRLEISSRQNGSEYVNIKIALRYPDGEEGSFMYHTLLTVMMGAVFLGDGLADFTGFPLFFYTMAIYTGVMLIYIHKKRKKLEKITLYSHRNIIQWGGTLFFGGIFLVYGAASLAAIIGGTRMNIYLMAELTKNMMLLLAGAAFPALFVFSVFLIISNLALMKNEGKRPANSLGIIAGVLLMGGDAAVYLLFIANIRWGISHVSVAVIYAISAGFLVIFQMLLSAAVICGLRAAFHKPVFDKDYIIILGCAIKKDGSLYPLIRGRVDSAIRFFEEQKKATGKEAAFVPSGGQGSDEVISEGEAMKNYLLSRGIPGKLILAETKSATTLENMKFSKQLIDGKNGNAKIAFSTTNYHVFRSGIFASQAGLNAEGIGSPTVWYFWPNAFLREVAALFAVHPKFQLFQAILLAVLAGLSGYWRYLLF